MKSLDGFDGVYKNRGRRQADPKLEELGRKPYYLCLSMFIWPEEGWEFHKSIDKVEVKALDADAILVKGFGRDGLVKEGVLTKGRDFELSPSGRISLPWRCGVPLPVVGVGFRQAELGIDLRGDGKYEDRTTFVGMLALLIPLAGTGTEEARFERWNRL